MAKNAVIGDTTMLKYVFSDRVCYQCSCGLRRPLRRIYFCKHCFKLRCGDCVSHEVDTHFCPNCLENMPSAEARLKKNRCANCVDCPSCLNTLSTRASTVSFPSPDDSTKTIPKKFYYLACGFCRWTSRDIGFKDKPLSSGGWPELENPHSKQIGSLLDHYRAVAQIEKMDRDRKKYPKRRTYLYFSDKYGMTTAIVRKRAGLPPLANLSLKDDSEGKSLEFSPVEAVEDIEPLSDDYFTKPVALHQVCTIKQRLSHPEFQPSFTKDMCPNHKLLLSKLSHRCKKCEHNLCKPEYNANSIKFKIQLAAYYHFPEVQIVTFPKFVSEQTGTLILSLSNPSQNLCNVFLLPLESDDPLVTADIQLPSVELAVFPQDDAAEFDDITENQPVNRGDPSIVAFQKANVVGVFVKVTPKKGEGEVRVAFRMKWDYHQTAIPIQGEIKEPEVMWLETRIDLDLGTVEAK